MKYVLILAAFIGSLLFTGCDPEPLHMGDSVYADGGAGGPMPVNNGLPTMNMPFAPGTKSQCTQGAFENYSHNSTSTRHGVDFDTPNNPADYPRLYAPTGGVARVHNGGGFGLHVNIDLGDDTYVVIAHMSQIDVLDGQWVDVGVPIGYAGCTGACSGAHVHLDLHQGSASSYASSGTSIPFNVFAVDWTVNANNTGNEVWGETTPAMPHDTRDLICGLTDGHVYESMLTLSTGAGQGGGVDDGADDPVIVFEDDVALGCQDGIDNDMDGYLDCLDQDCFGRPVCEDAEDPTPAPNPGSGQKEICWEPVGLSSPMNGELWVKVNGAWVTIAAAPGMFSGMCGMVTANSGDTVVLNGEYQAGNTPSNPWWICANTGVNYQVYGALTVDNAPVAMTPDIWGTGCDARIIVP